MSSEFVIDGNVGGYYDDSGRFIMCEEYCGSDADFGRYDVDIQNGNGYYNDDGYFVSYSDVD